METKYFKFEGMSKGYGETMRPFTKVMKVSFAILRENGHLSVIFVDDSLLQGDTEEQCAYNFQKPLNFSRNWASRFM